MIKKRLYTQGNFPNDINMLDLISTYMSMNMYVINRIPFLLDQRVPLYAIDLTS